MSTRRSVEDLTVRTVRSVKGLFCSSKDLACREGCVDKGTATVDNRVLCCKARSPGRVDGGCERNVKAQLERKGMQENTGLLVKTDD